jgi:hypothetical protein
VDIHCRLIMIDERIFLMKSRTSFLLIRCETCVENIFSKGTGNCPTCKSLLQKKGYRYQIFEDPFIELEMDYRKRILRE